MTRIQVFALLSIVPGASLRTHLDCSLLALLVPEQNLKQRGFPTTVGSHDRPTCPRLDREAQALKQTLASIALAEVFDPQRDTACPDKMGEIERWNGIFNPGLLDRGFPGDSLAQEPRRACDLGGLAGIKILPASSAARRLRDPSRQNDTAFRSLMSRAVRATLAALRA